MKTITVVTNDNCDEALYVDGELMFEGRDVYAYHIAEHAGDEPILFQNLECESDGDWPEKLEDVSLID